MKERCGIYCCHLGRQDIPKFKDYILYKRTFNQQSVITKVLFASFSSCLPLACSIFSKKIWIMPRHKFWVLLCTPWACNIHYQALYNAWHPLHTQCMYNKTQNLCLGNTKMCLVIARRILVRQLGFQGNKNSLLI